MPFAVRVTENDGLLLELTGGVTVRHAQELGKCLASSLTTGAKVTVQARDLDDIDTCILQLLASLRKTADTFVLQEMSAAFISAVDRCALRRELLPDSRDV